ncbi:MAG: hypothetical protein O2958_00615 [Gemmatimonadetes bacterium]|nr:hypothetical protein [Gemmatimonadota bacterium]MDA1102699.1 hypothetical protein [Gemmatimonadota bacterium]
MSPSDLIEASLELHWAAQLLASAGHTFAEPSADDSHRAMTWDQDRRAFVSAPFAGPYPFRVGLRPDDLTLLLIDRTPDPLGSLPLFGTKLSEGYEWLSLGLASYMGGAPPQLVRPEYDMPEHAAGRGSRFSGERLADFRALASLYAGAARILEQHVTPLHSASHVRCWPHHFDIATLITLDSGGSPPPTIGVGMAPMGGGYASWYWYVTPWPYPDSAVLPALTGPGAWHTEGWTGAVLTGEELHRLEESTRESAIKQFLADSIAAATLALSRTSPGS